MYTLRFCKPGTCSATDERSYLFLPLRGSLSSIAMQLQRNYFSWRMRYGAKWRQFYLFSFTILLAAAAFAN